MKFLLLMAMALTVCISARAADGDNFTDGNFEYTVLSETEHTASLSDYVVEPKGYVTIPSSASNGTSSYVVREIGANALDYCESLTSVIIPNSVTSIGDMAFYECSSLKTIIALPATPPTTWPGALTFEGVPQDAIVYVPYGTSEAYSQANEWSYFTDFREMTAFDIILDKNLLWLAVDEVETLIIVSGYTEGGIWSSADPDIATVDEDGVVKGVAPGTTTISFTVTDSYGAEHTQSCTVNVMGVTFQLPEWEIGEFNLIAAQVDCPATKATNFMTFEKQGGSSDSTNPDTRSFPSTLYVHWKLESAGDYNITLTITPDGYDKNLVFACRISIAESGIEGVTVDNDNIPAEYYNLNGVRVNSDALTPGLYIKRQGGKAEKVLVK